MPDAAALMVRAAADAFLQVGVWVAVMLAAVGLVQWWRGQRLAAWLAERPGLGPGVGALLGMTPGCGGAIVAMPLYARGEVTFGTVVATLVATMGDSSFVLLSAAPGTALLVHGLLVVTGMASGAAVDRLGVTGPRPASPGGVPAGAAAPSTVGAAAAPRTLLGRLRVRFPSPSLVTFWLLTAAGLVLSVLVVFHLVPESAVTLGGISTYLVVGAAGTALCLAAFAAGRLWDRGDNAAHLAEARRSLRGALLHAARETSFVTTWVVVAFAGWEGLVAATGWEAAMLPAAGLVGVAAGAAVGLIPGCGPQILLTGLYVQGGLPLPVLVANALSQDGDALFPLLASDRRSALLATAVTTVPALLVGGALTVVMP